MSKMFDALRRAEAERKRRNLREGEGDKPSVEPTPLEPLNRPEPGATAPAARPTPNGHPGLSEDFTRELGILRNSLEAVLGQKKKRALLFASATHEEGTTTLATSYAKLLSVQSQERILVIELNARRPALFWKLGLTGADGVTNYFKENRPLSSLTQRSPAGAYDVVHVGAKDPTTIQLHLERAFPKLIQEALRNYDVVIIDAPPIVVAPETPPMSAYVDGVVMVVQAERTKREVVERSLGMIGQFEGRVLGVILNRKKYYIPDFIYRRL